MDDASPLPPTVLVVIGRLSRGIEVLPIHHVIHSFCRFETDNHGYGKLKLHLLSMFLYTLRTILEKTSTGASATASLLAAVNHDVTPPFYSIK